MEESPEFLTTQLITYIGNKRKLLGYIEHEVQLIKRELKSEKVVCADLFSGSGAVARMLKQHSSLLIVNDLESYSRMVNDCYLQNKSSFPQAKYEQTKQLILEKASLCSVPGIIATNYAPQDDDNIKSGERAFYTRTNAILIDTYRTIIEQYADDDIKKYFLAPLITEASIHVNTSGVFKGFYKDRQGVGCFGGVGKNALKRIFGEIELKTPVFSNFESELEVHQEDAVKLSQKLSSVDIAYIDPPYNQHPYGSNYFMLNVILENKIDAAMSKVSGIPNNWNRSDFNTPKKAYRALESIIASLESKYFIISYNSEGFISFGEMTDLLSKYGLFKTVEITYNTFRGSRNLRSRDIHVSEYLFVLQKNI